MQALQEEKAIKYLAVTVTFMVCVTRLSMAVGQIANGVALLLGLYLWYKNKNTVSISEEAKDYIKAYGVFVILTLPSVLFSEKPLVGLKNFINLWFWHYIVFIVIIAFIKRRDYLVNMLTVFLYTTTIDCLLTVPQALLHMRGVHNQGWGLGGNPLYLAGIMCMLLPVALVIAMDAGFEKRLKKAASCAVAGIVVGLVFNKSRSAWLTELLVIPPFIYKYLKQKKKYLAIFVLVLAGVAVFMATSPAYVARVRSITNVTTNESNRSRLFVWNSAIQMLQDHPVTGLGLGQFRDHYSKYRSKQEVNNVVHAHSNYLHVAAETGLVGLAGLVFFIGYFLTTSLKRYLKYRDPYDRLIFVVFFSNIVMMGLFDYTLMMSSGKRIMWFLLAVLLNMKETEANNL